MRKIYKKLLTLLTALTLVTASVFSVLAITTETLDSVTGKTQVSGSAATGNFTVTMRDSNDVIEVYKIAEMVWDNANSTYKEVAWVTPVETWMNTNYPAYSTPGKLAAATSAIQSDVLKDLFGKLTGSTKTPIERGDLTKVDSGKIAKTDAVPRKYVTQEMIDNRDTNPKTGQPYTAQDLGTICQEAVDGYFTVSDQSFGIYMVLGTHNSVEYQPLTVSLVPEKDGANGNWYIKNDITASMKASDVTMEKKINNKNADEVRIGEKVEFEIEFTLPTYASRDTSNNNVAAYTLTFDDDLSPAFTLDSTSVKVQSRADSNEEWTDFDSKYYNAIIAQERTSTATPTVVNGNYGLQIWGCGTHHFELYTIYENAVKHVDEQGNASVWYYYYYYRDGAYHLLQHNGGTVETYKGSGSYISVPATPSATRLATAKTDGSYVRALYSAATGDTIGHGWNSFTVAEYSAWYKTTYGVDYNSNIFNITFNYDALIKAGMTSSNLELRIVYNATVNEKATVGAETNTNTATMKYEANSAGTSFATISDTVNAYTYSAQIIKQDGNDNSYLSGAEFELYKYSVTECKTYSTEEKQQYIVGNGKAYFYEYTVTDDNKTTDFAGCTTEGNHKHTKIFKLYTMATPTNASYFTGKITTVASANGVTIKGLDSGDYILKETKTPTAEYNELAEDIMFSINQLDENTISTTYGGSLKAFKDAADNVHEDGNYPITVLNYKGVTLPSTGGTGIVVFTVLGILLMTIAIVLVIVKNRKARRAAGTLMSVLVLASLVIGNASEAFAVSTIIVSDDYGAQVTGDNTASFKVELKDVNDTISVYQIAEMKWDSVAETYKDVAWVYNVGNWLSKKAEFKAYDTPEKLGAADTSVQTAFLDALLADKDTNNLESAQKVEEGFITKAGGGLSYTVAERPYGIYLIVGTNGTKTYQPLTVNVMPTQEGPFGHFFMKSNITANLKYETVQIQKTINGGDYATVKTGEKVSFEIIGEVPAYPEKAAEDTTKYPLSINDTMASAFAYDAGSATVEYTKNGTDWITLPEDAYTMLMQAKASGITSTSYGLGIYANGTNKLYVNVYDVSGVSYYDCYALDADSKQLTKLNDTALAGNFSSVGSISNTTVLAKYNALFGTSVASFSRQTTAGWEDVYNVTFDYDKLKALDVKSVRLSYTATVTTSVEVGTENNTNTAGLYYQKNAGGTIGTSLDTVHAYTYGMNLVKLDGESSTTAYLAGAKFNLYEAMYIYVPDVNAIYAESPVPGDKATWEVPGTDLADYASYKFAEDVKNGITAPTGYTATASAVVSLDNLSQVADVVVDETNGTKGDIVSSDTYYRKVTIPASATPCELDGYTKEHTHIHASVLLDDSIVSVATAAGVTINGLEPGTYVLKETLQPTGYNLLNEAIIFEINDLDEATANGTYNGSHAPFKADDGTIYTSGIYPIQVTNYKGVTLPSTGGTGTMLFIIIGIIVMTGAMLMVVVSKKKRAQELL